MAVKIRSAVLADAQVIHRISAPIVPTTAISFEETTPGVKEIAQRIP